MTRGAVTTLILAVVLVAPEVALAQESTSRYGRGIEIKAAPIFVNLHQGNAHWQDRKGVVGGISFGGHSQRRFDLVAEALYARRGASNLGMRADLNMLEVPVLMKINAGGSKTARFYGLVGPALDINLLTAQQRASRVHTVIPNAVIGAGVQLGQITLEARENIGLRGLAPNTPDLTARSFSLMVGIRVY
jgi:hypothetical protein